MVRTLLTALVAFVLLAPFADAQQRVMRDRQQPQQPGPNQSLSAVEIAQRGGVQCSYIRVSMMRDGLSIFCRERNSSPWNDYLLVFDGGTRPGGISAAMQLLLTYKELHREDPVNSPILSISYRQPGNNAQRLCDMMRNPEELPCFEAISISYS